MITRNVFLGAVQENTDRIREYQLGHSGSDGKSDCIGLIIGALALCGFTWPGVHGTNWAARNAMSTFDHIADPRKMFLGEIVFKAREPGESGYDLPPSYSGSPDQRDYYHVGVVTSAAPLVITHCTGVEGGIKRDSSLGKWRWGGKLKYVDYDTEEEPMEPYKATVHAENGYPVKMRKLPSTQSSIIMQVPLGSSVEVTGEVDAVWAAINYQGKDGYMMRKFLEPVGTETGGEKADLPVTLTAEEFNGILETLEKAVQVMKKARSEYEQV